MTRLGVEILCMTMESYYLGNVLVQAGMVVASGFDDRYFLSSPYAACGYFIESMNDYVDRVLMTD